MYRSGSLYDALDRQVSLKVFESFQDLGDTPGTPQGQKVCESFQDLRGQMSLKC